MIWGEQTYMCLQIYMQPSLKDNDPMLTSMQQLVQGSFSCRLYHVVVMFDYETR